MLLYTIVTTQTNGNCVTTSLVGFDVSIVLAGPIETMIHLDTFGILNIATITPPLVGICYVHICRNLPSDKKKW